MGEGKELKKLKKIMVDSGTQKNKELLTVSNEPKANLKRKGIEVKDEPSKDDN